MTDATARVYAYLSAQRIAMTAQEIASGIGISRDDALDHLRALEDQGQVCGAETGYYRVAGVRRVR